MHDFELETARRDYIKQKEKLQHVMDPIKLNFPRRVFSLRNSISKSISNINR